METRITFSSGSVLPRQKCSGITHHFSRGEEILNDCRLYKYIYIYIYIVLFIVPHFVSPTFYWSLFFIPFTRNQSVHIISISNRRFISRFLSIHFAIIIFSFFFFVSLWIAYRFQNNFVTVEVTETPPIKKRTLLNRWTWIFQNVFYIFY